MASGGKSGLFLSVFCHFGEVSVSFLSLGTGLRDQRIPMIGVPQDHHRQREPEGADGQGADPLRGLWVAHIGAERHRCTCCGVHPGQAQQYWQPQVQFARVAPHFRQSLPGLWNCAIRPFAAWISSAPSFGTGFFNQASHFIRCAQKESTSSKTSRPWSHASSADPTEPNTHGP